MSRDRDPEAVLVVKVFASPDADTPAAEVTAELYPDRIVTHTAGDADAVALGAEALWVAAGADRKGSTAPLHAAGLGGVLLGSLFGGGE